ncbi:hypothetical protein CYMTET_43102 [Cymbomonas tetramitiformis]|uniref:Uncharacterized protein n=1 Tax=Cymbomonas tetramitiformis TaxID=36881 RepID=A0AAE0C452_9CHLO|nr:hypothetical protein CYMTET_43102 [Cymbomonas tetramitiformis]
MDTTGNNDPLYRSEEAGARTANLETTGQLQTSLARSRCTLQDATISEDSDVIEARSPEDRNSADSDEVTELHEGVRMIQGIFSFCSKLCQGVPSEAIARLVEPALPCTEKRLFDIVCEGLAAPPLERDIAMARRHGDGVKVDTDTRRRMAPAHHSHTGGASTEPAPKKHRVGSTGDGDSNVLVLDCNSDDENGTASYDTGEQDEEDWQEENLEYILSLEQGLPYVACHEESIAHWERFTDRCTEALGSEHFLRTICDEALWLASQLKPEVLKGTFDVDTWKRDVENCSSKTQLAVLRRLEYHGIDWARVDSLYAKENETSPGKSKWNKPKKSKPREINNPPFNPGVKAKIIQQIVDKFNAKSQQLSMPDIRIHKCPSQIRSTRNVSKCFCLYEQVIDATSRWDAEAGRHIAAALRPHLEFFIMDSLQAGGSSYRTRLYGVTPPPEMSYGEAGTGPYVGKSIKELYVPPWPEKKDGKEEKKWPKWAEDIYKNGFLKCIRTKLHNSALNVNDINAMLREAHQAGRDVHHVRTRGAF